MLFDLIFILVCGFSYYMCYALWDDVLYALLYSNQTLYLIYIQIRYFLQTPLGLAALSWSIPKTYQLFIRSKLVQIRIRLVFSRVVSGSAFSPRPNPVFLEIRSESGVGAKNDPVAPPPLSLIRIAASPKFTLTHELYQSINSLHYLLHSQIV